VAKKDAIQATALLARAPKSRYKEHRDRHCSAAEDGVELIHGISSPIASPNSQHVSGGQRPPLVS
jgi:hypothetical protein